MWSPLRLRKRCMKSVERKVAVVGYGAIGRHHARNLASFAGVNFVGVVETAPAARAEAAQAGFQVLPSLAGALDAGVEAVVLAVPTALHRELALQAFSAGCAVLVEKPIAENVRDGEAIIAAARSRGVALMIGYVERYNPAVVALKRFLAAGHMGRLFSISTRRVGVMPARIKDANVLVDIGVHDIDAVAFIAERPLELRSALGGRALLEDRLDFATLSLDASGIAVSIETNWITPVKIRELYVTGENGICHVDYITQAARFAARADIRIQPTFEGTVANYRSGQWTTLDVEAEEPLRRELRTFIAALNGGPLPDPEIALISLRIAEEATAAIESAVLAR
jgi:UDP-N-acetylglucosamine 3-dehydrogenase